MKKSFVLRITLLRLYLNTFGRLFVNQSAKLMIRLFSTPQSRVIREKEIEVLKEAKQNELIINGEKIVIYEWGSGSKSALLCHGWESNAGSLGAFVPLLNNLGYRVISYDGPAHGKSSGKRTNLFEFTEITKKIKEEFQPISLFVGHSLGADVIMLLAKKYNIEMDKCVLISPVNSVRDVFEGFKKIFSIPEIILKRMIKLLELQNDYTIDQLNFDRFINDCKIKNALILHDLDDKITPFSHSKQLNENWENARLQEIKGSGHYKILWNQNTLKSTVTFLEN